MKHALYILLIFTLFPAVSHSTDKTYSTAKVDEVTSIYDADTFRANINQWPLIIGQRVPVRIAGVDAPEIRGKCEKEKQLDRKAKQFTVAKLRGAKVIELRNMQRGKYF